VEFRGIDKYILRRLINGFMIETTYEVWIPVFAGMTVKFRTRHKASPRRKPGARPNFKYTFGSMRFLIRHSVKGEKG
jgi:hypothetical protein